MNKIKKDEYWRDSFWGLLFKTISIILTFYNVRLMISYLGKDIYGDWITISSIVTWMSAGDFGIANGLRNEISKLYSHKNFQGIINTIYSTNKLFAFISIVMLVSIIIIGWILSRFEIIKEYNIVPFIIMASAFAISIFWGRIQIVAMGIQKTWYSSFSSVIGTTISIICFGAFKIIKFVPSVMVCACIYVFVTLFPLFLITLMLKIKVFNRQYSNYKYYDADFVKRIFKSGIKFFVLQITSVVLFSTDNVLVKYLFGSAEVTRYSLINQVYNVGTSLFLIFMNPFWSGVAIHFEKKDIRWISQNIIRLLILLMFFSIGILTVSIFFNSIVFIWIHDDSIIYSCSIITIFAIYCFFDCLQSIFGNLNYGIGNTKVIMYLGVFSAFVNIPLSVFFSKILNLGIAGIKLGTLVSLLPSWICIIIISIVIIIKFKRNLTK